MFQYFHNQQEPSRYTVAVSIPEKSRLEHLVLLDSEKDINISLGMSFVHPKDRYVKSIGRKLSLERMQTLLFTLVEVQYNQDCMFLELYNSEIILTMKLNKCSNRAHFINAVLL